MTTAIAQAVSAALLHFVWQGLTVALLLWMALFALRKRSANSRYLASCMALAVLAVQLVPADWAALQSPMLRPIILCGEYLVEVFCVSVFLTFAAQSVFVEVANTPAVRLAAGVLGIILMSAVAELISLVAPLAAGRSRRLGGK